MEFEVQINKKDLYDFQLHHTYTSPSGLFGAFVGCFLICLFFYNHQPLLLIIGLFDLAYFPWTLNIRSAQLAASEAFKIPLHYELTDEGIHVTQGEAEVTALWSQVTKVISTRKSILVYTSKVNAYIMPRRILGERTVDLIEYISTHVEPSKVKIKY